MWKITALMLVALSLAVTGCTHVEYGDATARETVNTDFGSTDLQMIASKMVDDLLTSRPIVKLTANRRPVVFIEGIHNKTMQHIDTQSVTDTIQSKLINSGKFRFVDMTRVEAVRKQLAYQNQSGMVNQATAVQMGHQIGAEFMLYGNLSAITKSNSDVKDVYYKFTLKLMNLKTGIIEWSSEKQIRKQEDRSLFGW